MIDGNGNHVHYRKGTKVIAFGNVKYCCVNVKNICALEEILEHEDLDADYTPSKSHKTYIPPMNHLGFWEIC